MYTRICVIIGSFPLNLNFISVPRQHTLPSEDDISCSSPPRSDSVSKSLYLLHAPWPEPIPSFSLRLPTLCAFQFSSKLLRRICARAPPSWLIHICTSFWVFVDLPPQQYNRSSQAHPKVSLRRATKFMNLGRLPSTHSDGVNASAGNRLTGIQL